ncbi:MAG: hypothetical protein Q4D48_08700 [Coriobacteriales bacterium]|nr:hypothetical protein [Coriobacteriales bacterium]
MRYYSGFDEAFYYAYRKGRQAFLRAESIYTPHLSDCASRAADIAGIDLETPGILPAPAMGPGCLHPNKDGLPVRHVLVAQNGNRHDCKGLARHGWSAPLAPKSIVRVGPGIYMSTPEFTFLQLANVLPHLPLVLAGFALCSSYYIDPQTRKVTQRSPISSVAELQTYLNRCRGSRGVKRGRAALRCVTDGAESPQEVNQFLLMSLPVDMGGHGIEGLEMNYTVRVEDADRGVLDRPDRTSFRIDMGCKELKKGAEYLGKDHESTVDEDRERLNSLMALGHQVLQVKYADLTNPTKCARLARQLARLLNIELPELTPAQELARANLADELFGMGRLVL